MKTHIVFIPLAMQVDARGPHTSMDITFEDTDGDAVTLRVPPDEEGFYGHISVSKAVSGKEVATTIARGVGQARRDEGSLSPEDLEELMAPRSQKPSRAELQAQLTAAEDRAATLETLVREVLDKVDGASRVRCRQVVKDVYQLDLDYTDSGTEAVNRRYTVAMKDVTIETVEKSDGGTPEKVVRSMHAALRDSTPGEG